MILKMVDDRKTIFVLYILTHMKTKGLYDCSTYRGSFIVNEGAGCKCTRTFIDVHCASMLFEDDTRDQRKIQKNCRYI